MEKKQIGLFFGTFNPIHNGHLMAATYALEHSYLDEIWFVVSPSAPFKEKRDALLPLEERIKMINMVTNSYNMRAIDDEKYLKEPTYSIKTLNYLSEKYPNCEFTMIIGADNYAVIFTFYHHEEILTNYKLIVLDRLGYDKEKLHILYPKSTKEAIKNAKSITFLDGSPSSNLSSTFIRNEIKNDKNIEFYVPFVVRDIILTNKYYR